MATNTRTRKGARAGPAMTVTATSENVVPQGVDPEAWGLAVKLLERVAVVAQTAKAISTPKATPKAQKAPSPAPKDEVVVTGRRYRGWPRNPDVGGGLMWLPLPAQVAALVEDTEAFSKSFVTNRRVGRGSTVILAPRPKEARELLATFKALIDTDNKALAERGVRRVSVEAPMWSEGIVGLRKDGWPLRSKSTAVS